MVELNRIFDIIDNYFRQFPDKSNALCYKENGEWKSYSVREYHEIAYSLCLGLLELGLEKGDRVATISNNRPEWNFMDMAISQAGMIHVPIYPTISDGEYEYILNHCQPSMLVLSDNILFQKLAPIAKNVPGLKDIYSYDIVPGAKFWKEIYHLGSVRKPHIEQKLYAIRNSILTEDTATLIYTSGTTGNPKGVELTHKNILSNIKSISKVFDFTERDRTLSFLPICHVFERTINYYFQAMGVAIYYAENLGSISQNLKEVQPSVFITVPRVLELIYDKITGIGKELKGFKQRIFFWAVNFGLAFDFKKQGTWIYKIQLYVFDKLVFSKWRKALGNNLRLLVSGGAALQPRLSRVFNAAGIPLVEGYGMTETSPVIAVNVFHTGEVMIGTVGPVLPGVNVKIADDGEILVKGDSVMKGYYKDEELTLECFKKDGWLCTGDVGEFIDNKYLKITDRKKEIFKLSSGKYIAPQVIENKLKESPYIDQAMVVGENEKFASALISPNFSYIRKWCSGQGILFNDNAGLVGNLKVVELFQKEINEINRCMGQTEQIKRFRLVSDEWTYSTGELSPTLKLKRRFIFEKYRNILKDIYLAQKTE